TKGTETNITLDDRMVATVKGNIVGTYIHGIFDNKIFTDMLLNKIRKSKGMDEKSSEMTFDEYRMNELDKLEVIMRENIDVKAIYSILGGK
ncbi:MAG: cobyric acid synthase CobQ, partial [Cetobacterium sp.]